MLVKALTIGKDGFPIRALGHVRPARRNVRVFINVILQRKGYVNFICLYDSVGTDDPKEGGCLLVGNSPSKELPVIGVLIVTSIVKVTFKLVVECLNRWVVTHIYSGRNVVANVVRLVLNLFLKDVDKAFTIKDTSSVIKVHLSLQVGIGMVVNSGKTQCPARKGTEGQSRAKQVPNWTLGVCNEHVPPSEEKMCSELHGNMQRLAEMTNSSLVYLVVKSISKVVTDCNTKYLHWRPHARRNMVPLDPDRFSINQDAMIRLIGWAGNMTLSNAFLQGTLTT